MPKTNQPYRQSQVTGDQKEVTMEQTKEPTKDDAAKSNNNTKHGVDTTGDSSTTTTTTTFLDLHETNRYFYQGANYSIVLWIFLWLGLYLATPRDEWVYLKGTEQHVAAMAFGVLLVATILLILPILVYQKLTCIVYAAIVVQGIALVTNFILAFGPNIVRIDVVTQAPVYLTRWCEWIPLGGYMTFLSEGILIQNNNNNNNNKGLKGAVYSALAQTLSCLCGGLICAYCPDVLSWSLSMLFAVLTWAYIFPRVYQSRKAYLEFQQQSSQATTTTTGGGVVYFPDPQQQRRELLHRHKFSYHLMLTCSFVWTILVVMYCVSAYLHRYHHPKTTTIIIIPATAMMFDTVFDVLAKVFYMKCILDVHHAVFYNTIETRALHQLSELRNLMSVVWDKSSDVIIISVCQNDRLIAMLSPSFQKLIGTTPETTTCSSSNSSETTPTACNGHVDAIGEDTPASPPPARALVLELVQKSPKENPQVGEEEDDEWTEISMARFITTTSSSTPLKEHDHDDNDHVPPQGSWFESQQQQQQQQNLEEEENNNDAVPTPIALAARTLLITAWNQSKQNNNNNKNNNHQDSTTTTTPPTTTTSQNRNSKKGRGNNQKYYKKNNSYPFETMSGEIRECEMNVSQHGTNSVIAIARDITERARRLEAEQRAHAEALRRQKESQSQTRFVRHEVKNGLLAGIELCDSLRGEIDDSMRSIQDSSTIGSTTEHNNNMSAYCSAIEFTGGSTSMPPMSMSTSTTTFSTHQQDATPVSPSPSSFLDASLRSNTSNSTTTKNNNSIQEVQKAKRHVESLDLLLHEVLDTVLAEAFARDVVAEIYKPRLERLNVVSYLTNYVGRKRSTDSMDSSRRQESLNNNDRFPIKVVPAGESEKDQESTSSSLHEIDLPLLMLDPQLLQYIHRNAVSNATKYGKIGGKVETLLSFDSDNRLFHMKVINQPGLDHDQMVDLEDDVVEDIVFSQGTTLHLKSENRHGAISTGNGAWIMQKCAKTMGGNCSICFEKDKTIFSFVVPAEPITISVSKGQTTESTQKHHTNGQNHHHDHQLDADSLFEIPPNTIGIAIDDAKIQRKLMGRLLSNIGIALDKVHILGETPHEVMEMQTLVTNLMTEHPDSYILMLVDENLDYTNSSSSGSCHCSSPNDSSHMSDNCCCCCCCDNVLLSGSLITQKILQDMPQEQEGRVLALVRSANDSTSDVALYMERTHGFFPKAPMQKERVREILAPLWRNRFAHKE